MAHFLSPCKEQINFLRLWLDIFLSLGFLIFGAAPWLPPSGGSGPRLHASPENGYFCRGEFICASLWELPSFSLPRHLPKRNEMDGSRSEARRREAELILVDTCRTGDITPHLTIYFTKWPEYILCKAMYSPCAGRFVLLVHTVDCSLRVLSRFGGMLINYTSDKSDHIKQVSPQTRIRVKLMNQPKVRGTMSLFSLHCIPFCQKKKPQNIF